MSWSAGVSQMQVVNDGDDRGSVMRDERWTDAAAAAAAAAGWSERRSQSLTDGIIAVDVCVCVWSCECWARRVTRRPLLNQSRRSAASRISNTGLFAGPARPGPVVFGRVLTNVRCDWLLATPTALNPEVFPTTSVNCNGQPKSADRISWIINITTDTL